MGLRINWESCDWDLVWVMYYNFLNRKVFFKLISLVNFVDVKDFKWDVDLNINR